jgi:hypothetical protein
MEQVMWTLGCRDTGPDIYIKRVFQNKFLAWSRLPDMLTWEYTEQVQPTNVIKT